MKKRISQHTTAVTQKLKQKVVLPYQTCTFLRHPGDSQYIIETPSKKAHQRISFAKSTEMLTFDIQKAFEEHNGL